MLLFVCVVICYDCDIWCVVVFISGLLVLLLVF